MDMMSEGGEGTRDGVRIDVCHWVNRATFDVIGQAGLFLG
jgi:hypothetical protein